MAQTLTDFLSLFGGKHNVEREDLDSVAICITGDSSIPPVQDFIIDFLNSRDRIFVTFQMGDNEPIVYTPGKQYSEFVSNTRRQLDIREGERLSVNIKIEKKNVENVISIYSFRAFVSYICALSLKDIVAVFSSIQKEPLCFEVLFEHIEICSSSITFIPVKHQNPQEKPKHYSNRGSRSEAVKNICHSTLQNYGDFLPEDFCIIQSQSGHSDICDVFNRLALLFAISYLFENVTVKSNNVIHYKLNGYKTIVGEIDFNALQIDNLSEYIKIYDWCYNEGNLVDKIGLARNIISLHLSHNNTLVLTGSPYSSILSNYEIYRKQNIKQYIEIRNKLSDHLIDLKEKADKIVDNFASDFKKSLFAFVSFFASVVVVQVLRNGNFIDAFSRDATLLSIAFLLIAFLFFLASHWELNQQRKRYRETYKNLKSRQKDLLNDDDLNRILNDDADFKSNIQYITEKGKVYSRLWLGTIVVFFVAIVVLYIIRYGGSLILGLLLWMSCPIIIMFLAKVLNL